MPPDIIDKETSGDMIVQEGDDVTLKCKAKGHPTPTIEWRRENSQEIVLDAETSGKFYVFNAIFFRFMHLFNFSFFTLL